MMLHLENTSKLKYLVWGSEETLKEDPRLKYYVRARSDLISICEAIHLYKKVTTPRGAGRLLLNTAKGGFHDSTPHI